MSADKSQMLEFKHRIGPDPHANGAKTAALDGCPDIWELEDGNFAVIGIDVTERVHGRLPESAGCGPDEKVVLLPRELVLKARSDLSKLV